MRDCLDAEEALSLLEGRCCTESLDEIEEHIDTCAACRRFMAEIVHAQTPDSSAMDHESARETATPILICSGQRVGRYIANQVVGVGAMGVVYSAYDPELDRRIALKLLRRTLKPNQDAERLRREAKAMARVSHVNVARVFDVGRFGDAVFITMEFIDGPTLTSWLSEQERPWREIVDVFLQAGRGLAAAHDAGLVHRDFKPDNVLLSQKDERVCVTDFGLVGADRDAFGTTTTPTTVPVSLTQTGALLGTPVYMAPEQMNRMTVDARSDQFSFAIALFEALYGKRPFRGNTLGELCAAKQSGQIEQVESPVQPGMHAALLRALSAAPEQRFPSMHDLLHVMESARAPKRRTPIMIFLAGAFVLISGILLMSVAQKSEATPTCQGAEEQLVGIWDQDLRQHFASAMAKVTGSALTREHLLGLLDSHTARWKTEHVSACKATRVSGHQSERVLELRMACLNHNLLEFQSLTHEAMGTEQLDLDRAVQAVVELSSPSECANVAALEGRSSELAALENTPQRLELRRRIAAVQAKMRMGQTEAALPLAEALMADVDSDGSKSLAAQTRHVLAELLEEAGRIDEAKRSYESALPLAVASNNETLVAILWLKLVHLVGYVQKDHQGGHRLAEVVRVSMGRSAEQRRLELLLHFYLGMIAYSEGDYLQSEIELRSALKGYEDMEEATRPQTLQVLHNLGDTLQRQGKMEEANEISLQVLATRTELYGPEHSSVASSLAQLAHYDYQRGKYRQALERYERSLQILQNSVGQDSPKVAASHSMVGSTLRVLGDVAGAREHHEKALDIWKRTLGPTHPAVALALNNLANTYYQEARFTEAHALLQQAYDIKKASLGAEHPEVATAVFNLGEVVRAEKGSCREARVYWQEALTIRENALDAKHPDLAYPLTSLGACHVELGTMAQARSALERALTIRIEKNTDPLLMAETQFALAQALWPQPAQRRRALELAEAARTSFAGGLDHAKQRDEVESWLAKVGAP